ncbi:MAG: 4-hydroxybenzoate octaprenyltransferase [Gemmatimonadetes bacterium]|nr:4-hydroxybenzoate octaprenyltransferase [Gemmatimonadota bacterium]
MSERKTEVRRPGLRADLSAVGQGLARPREGQTFAGDSLLVSYVNLVRLPHTLFALPFALVGVVYASWSAPVTVRQVGLVLVAFTAARFAAMGFNRIADRRLDALNPRTRSRELPSGRLSVAQAGWAVAGASVLFLAAAGLLNTLCLVLAPLALAWILTYSYTKRVTSWSHIWLGASLAIAPVGGYLAVTGTWSTPGWVLPAIATAVLCWVSGFDIFYALQDRDFDREHRLRSAVVLLGDRGSIYVAKSLHGLAILLLSAFGIGAGLGWLYFAGVLVSAAVLAWEHRLVRSGDLTRLGAAFFTMNGIMSTVVFAGILADRLL